MELLRITAMLMVLCLHATFETFGWPRASMVQGDPWRWLALMVVNALTLPCVDVFVLITGGLARGSVCGARGGWCSK